MEKLFVPYPLALLAKEKGFKDKCLTYYGLDKDIKSVDGGWYVNSAMTATQCSAPLYQQLTDWFREKHGVHICVYVDFLKINYCWSIRHSLDAGGFIGGEDSHKAKAYYEALTAALYEAFKLI